MIAIQNTLVSENLLEKKFACDLNACKGGCCVEGDGGAPLKENEVSLLEQIIDDIKPFMEEQGMAEVEQKGVFVIGDEGDIETPLVDNKACAYATFENGIAKCAIEKAYQAGRTDFKKPISCHLYPVRIKELKDYEAVNVDYWDICQPAYDCGAKIALPLFRFLKEALIRKFGPRWYAELEKVSQHWKVVEH